MSAIISPIAVAADSNCLSLSVTPSVVVASLGETITYNYVISSTCNTTIDALVLTDDKLGSISLSSTSIAPGENVTGTATYTVAAVDFPGPIVNSGNITGVSTDNETITATAAGSVELNPVVSSIGVTLTADRTVASEGDNITYTYTIINTGEVDLNGITLTDQKLGTIALSSDNLTPGAQMIAAGKYTVLGTDLPGPLVNMATVHAIDTIGASVSASSSTVSVNLNAPLSSISVSLSANATEAHVGDNVTYNYTITNTGESALSGITLTDQKVGTITLASDNLSVGDNMTVTGIRTVLSTDLPGPLSNVATVTALNSSGATVTASSATVFISLGSLTSSISVGVTANTSEASEGDNVTYTYTITNTGEDALTGIVLTDQKLGTITLASDNLSIGAQMTVSKVYTVLSTDLPGPLTTIATVTAVNSSNNTVSASSATLSIDLHSMESSVSVSLSANKQKASPGETIVYTYTISNTGEDTLSSIVLSDEKLGTITLTATSLSAGSQMASTGSYKVLDSDLPGPIINTAKVTALDSAGASVTASSASLSITLSRDWSHLTKGEIHRLRGVPGKGIDHAPGQQKYFNPNSHADDNDRHESNNKSNKKDNGKGHQGNNKNKGGDDEGGESD
jgi:uncharacterized repeat protein (TIGR01451 family)